MQFHCLGSATLDTAEKFPFKSMDATSHIQKGMYGLIICEYGTIYVGDKDIVDSMPDTKKQALQRLCDKYHVSLDRLTDNWLERALFCMAYTHEMSHKTQYVKAVPIKRGLF